MPDNDILIEQAHRRTEVRRALASEEGSLDGIKASRHLSIFNCELVLLQNEGKIEKLARGIYAAVDYQVDEKQSFMEVCKRVPEGVICLLSALRFHEFTTQNPFEIWIAIDIKARTPSFDYPPIRAIRFSGDALCEGIEIHEHRGVRLKVYNPAKTVADCFKFRNKIGWDVALEALREGWKNKLFTIAELNKFGKICRVERIMRPYIESLL